MEAAFITFLINKFGGIAVDQAQSRCSQLLLQHTTPPLDQIHARIERNFTTFRLMKKFLERSNQSTAVADDNWTQEVRVVAFKMEDILDEYLYLVREQRGRTWKNFLPRPSNLCCSLAKDWRGIDSQLENMERDLSELARAKDLFGNGNRGNENRVKNSERDTHQYYRAYSPMLIDEDDLVGIEENKSKLVSWLTNADTCREMTAIAVWGMGGQGKTTLVANVYRNNAVKSHFDCQVWVTVSQTYSVDELLRTMIQEIYKEKKESVPNGIATMPKLELFEIIRESLQGKRYIIVLDDVWQVNLFIDIGRALADNNNGSRLVVTSRKHDVARIAKDEHMIELQHLNPKDAWILFCKKAFRKENNNVCPQELEVYSQRILKKCKGSPLAITVIGSLLSTKEKSESGWKEVYDCLHWEFEKNPSLDALTGILNLSFNDLPNYLKNCFVYCSIFPEDYLIKRKRLIRLWVAEGLIEAKSSNDRVMEEEAEYYLTQLVDRSMLQVAKRNDFGRLKAFRMHDVVREVTLEISKMMRFCMILHGSQSVLDDQTRRLSIQITNYDKSLDLTSSLLSLSRLRSLAVFSSCNFSSGSLRAVLIRFKTLRVLELQGVQISNLPNEVSALFNLHYLGLRDTEVKRLPNNIQKLQSLQTLDLSGSNIVKIPHGVTQLKQLRHLLASYCEVEFGESTVVGCFPTLEEACQWKNLQTLRRVEANEKLVQLLGDVRELRSLEVMMAEQAHCQLFTSLTKMSNLRNLRLHFYGSEGLNFEMLNSPPPLLQKLELWGRLFEGKMPTFICSCAELTHVRLWGSQLIEDPLPSFGQLPKLAEFRLTNDAYDGQKLHFKTGWFLNLKLLCLEGLKNLNDIVIEEGAMISLRELDLSDLRELKMVPGIEFLTHLKTLYLQEMPEELREKLERMMTTNKINVVI